MTRIELAEMPDVFFNDLSETDTARLPIVTVLDRLQKTAYPALLHRRNLKDVAAYFLVVFKSELLFEGAKVTKISKPDFFKIKNVLLKSETHY